MRDGKGQFYRTLNLDKPTRRLIRWYRIVKYQIDRNRNENKITPSNE